MEANRTSPKRRESSFFVLLRAHDNWALAAGSGESVKQLQLRNLDLSLASWALAIFGALLVGMSKGGLPGTSGVAVWMFVKVARFLVCLQVFRPSPLITTVRIQT